MRHTGQSPFNALGLIRPIPPFLRRLLLALLGAHVLWVLIAQLAPTVYASTVLPNTALSHRDLFVSWRLWTLLTHAVVHEVYPSPLLSLLTVTGLAWLVWTLLRSPFAQRDPFVFLFVVFLLFAVVNALGLGASLHVVGNVIGLYFFAPMFLTRWGSRRFLHFCAYTVLGGGLLSWLSWWLIPSIGDHGVIGASAIIMGLLAAFAVYHPNDTVLYGLVVPLKGKYFLLIALAFDLISLIGRASGQSSGVAVFAHLGGALAGWLLTTGYWRPSRILRKRGASKRPRLRLVPPPDDNGPHTLH